MFQPEHLAEWLFNRRELGFGHRTAIVEMKNAEMTTSEN
jgi:hypothetical protein